MGAPIITGKGFDKLAASWSQSGDTQRATMALDLSDDNIETFWLIVVKVKTTQGEYILGTVRTRSPAAGDPKARTVLIAWHPGVLQWSFDFYGPRGATARPQMSTDFRAGCDCGGGGGSFGIVPQNGSLLERQIWTPSPSPVAFAQQGLLSPGPAALVKAYGIVEVAAAAQLYVGFVDSLAPVVGGEQFAVLPRPVPTAWPRVVDFDFQPGAVPFSSAIRWVISTSPLIVALGAAGDVGLVQGERL